MSRLKTINEPGDYPAGEAAPEDIKALFDKMFPGVDNPRLARSQAGFSVVARNPQLGLHLLKLAKFVAGDLSFCHRVDLRELAVQALNYHFKCDLSFEAHIPYALANGITAEQQAAIPYWRTTSLFNDEQRLVVEYALAVCENTVTDELSARVVAQFGELKMVEFTTAVAWWSFWAMIINATRP